MRTIRAKGLGRRASSCHAKPEDYDEMRCAEMMWSRASIKVCGSAAIERGSPARAEGASDAGARELAQLPRLMVLKGGGRGPTKLGVVPLSDGAGEVAAIGGGIEPEDKMMHGFRPHQLPEMASSTMRQSTSPPATTR
jgi:hypothetical protein